VIARRRVVAAALALCAVTAGACGDDGTTGEESPPKSAGSASRLTLDERRLVSDSEAAIQLYCRKRALALTDPDKRPTVGQQARALEAVDALVALADEKPAARLRRGVDVRLFLGDLAENLEGSNCDPAIVARLDEGISTLAPEDGVRP
jgi:hypothetical protein